MGSCITVRWIKWPNLPTRRYPREFLVFSKPRSLQHFGTTWLEVFPPPPSPTPPTSQISVRMILGLTVPGTSTTVRVTPGISCPVKSWSINLTWKTDPMGYCRSRLWLPGSQSDCPQLPRQKLHAPLQSLRTSQNIRTLTHVHLKIKAEQRWGANWIICKFALSWVC